METIWQWILNHDIQVIIIYTILIGLVCIGLSCLIWYRMTNDMDDIDNELIRYVSKAPKNDTTNNKGIR